jgi:hypothetical protein
MTTLSPTSRTSVPVGLHLPFLPLPVSLPLSRTYVHLGPVLNRHIYRLAQVMYAELAFPSRLTDAHHSIADDATVGLESCLSTDTLFEIYMAIHDAVSDFVPAKRLVGIETNPGPPRSALASVGVALGKALATAQIAATKKKKNNKKQKKKNVSKSVVQPRGLNTRRTLSTIMAPLASGVLTSNGGAKHKPFVIAGRGLCASLTTNSGSQPVLTGANGSLTAGSSSCLTLDVDVAGTSNSTVNFQLFPPQIYSLSTVFLKWRLRKLIFTYVPSCSTQTNGMILFCTTPEPMSGSNAGPTNLDASYVENAVSGPVWSSFSLDALKNGLSSEWLYCDTTSTVVQASLRQETAGSLSIGMFNQGVLVNYGTLWADYEVEFDALAFNTDYGSKAKFPTALPSPPSSSFLPSSFPPLPPPLSSLPSQHPEQVTGPILPEDLSDSIYISAEMLNKIRLGGRNNS